MNKKGVSLLLKFIIGLVIAIMVIWVLLTLVDKFIIFGEDEKDYQVNFFNELNREIKESELNKEITKAFQLQKEYLIIAFNNKDTEVNLKDIEIYSGKNENVITIIKKPPACENCLCLCKTKNYKILFEDDCLQQIDLCIDHEKSITNNGSPFFLFGEGMRNLKIERTTNNINIEYE